MTSLTSSLSEQVPKHPALSLAALRERRVTIDIPSVLDAGPAVFLNRGAFAIAEALRLSGVTTATDVLMPAYHCTSMVEPALWLQARPVFYRIREDLSPDPDDLLRKITPKTRALLVPHYFGFTQSLADLYRLARAHDIALIEDCAHAFFGSVDSRPVGACGDYAIASPWKFFPIIDGGCLISARHSLASVALCRPGLRFQLKAAANALEYGLLYRRLGRLNPFFHALVHLKDKLIGAAHDDVRENDAEEGAGTLAQAHSGIDRARSRSRMSIFSRALMNRMRHGESAPRRRHNYLRFAGAVADLPGCRPLHPRLSEECVPQVFPLVMDKPEEVFPMLKSRGVPIIRFGEFLWPGVDAAVCPVSADLSRRIFQFPIHQDLTAAELDWMIERVREAVLAAG